MRYLREAERDGLLFRQILYFCVCQGLWSKAVLLWHKGFRKSSPSYPVESFFFFFIYFFNRVWAIKGKENKWVAEDFGRLIWSYRSSMIRWQPCQAIRMNTSITSSAFSFTYLHALLSSLSVFLKPWHFRLPGDAVCQAVTMVTAAHFAALAAPELFSCRDGASEGGSVREKKPTCWLPANWLFLFLAHSVPSPAILL